MATTKVTIAQRDPTATAITPTKNPVADKVRLSKELTATRVRIVRTGGALRNFVK